MTREESLDSIYILLQRLLGLHRQLLEAVRAEKEALTLADVRKIQDSTLSKETIIDSVRICEQQRQQAVGELAMIIKTPTRELTLAGLILIVQGFDLKRSNLFRSLVT